SPRRVGGEENPARHRVSIKNREGEEKPCEAILKSVEWQDGKALMLAIRLDEASAGDERLRERIEELTTILDTATDGVVLIRPDGTIRSANHSAEALFGQNAAEL